MHFMLIVALFKIAKTWKQLKCPSTDEWFKMWYTYTMEYYSAIKRMIYTHTYVHTHMRIYTYDWVTLLHSRN